MERIHIQELPDHRLAWIGVPAGSGPRGARLCSGEALAHQYLPAPFPDALEGFLLIRSPGAQAEIELVEAPPVVARDAAQALSLGGDGLHLTLDGKAYTLSDTIENVDAPGMPNQELAFDAVVNQGGVFRLFGEQARLFTVSDGPIARIERVLTHPVNRENGEALAGVEACYDFVFYKVLKMVQVIASFRGGAPARATFFHFMNLALSRAFTRWEGGLIPMEGEVIKEADDKGGVTFLPRSFDHYGGFRSEDEAVAIVGAQVKLGEADGCLTLTGDAEKLNRDIGDYGPAHPFSACLIYGADAKPCAWVNELPAFYRVETCTKDCVELRAGDLLARFASDGHGADLIELVDKSSGKPLASGGGNSLFAVTVRDIRTCEQIALNSLRGWRQVSLIPGGDGERLTMVFDEAAQAPGISVILTARCDGAQSRISWEVDVQNASDSLTVVQAEYPRLPYDAQRRFNIFTPAGSGETYEDIRQVGLHVYMTYSDAWASMQYMCVYGDGGRGLYYGVHDPEPNKKNLVSDKQSFTGRGRMFAEFPAMGIGEPRNSQKLPGQAAWQLYSGDWYDAAQIYREWVLPNARWSPAMTDHGRPDIPQWLRETPLWFQVSVGTYRGGSPDGDWTKPLLEAARDIGVPTAVHLYNWHQIPFDNDYPHYLPARPEFIEELPKLKDAGIKAMPYINSRLWDTRDRKAEDYQFTSVAKPGAVKNMLGNVVTEAYGSKEEDGSPVRLAVMCTTAAVWQEKQREICQGIFEMGVDGIYLDQIAAQTQPLCFDKTHAHRPGGGSWWADGYYHFLDHMRKVLPENCIYTTECTAEMYMNRLDAYLSWHWARASQVPAFSAVYAGYIPFLGRVYNGDDTKFRILISQSLLFGDQIGWFGPEKYLNSPDRALWKKVVQARWRFAEFFYAGRMLRPPTVECGLPELTTLKAFANVRAIHSPAVRGALWRRLKDGAKVLLLVNIADEEAEVTVTVDVPDCEVVLTGDIEGVTRVEKGELFLRLPPLSVVAGGLK